MHTFEVMIKARGHRFESLMEEQITSVGLVHVNGHEPLEAAAKGVAALCKDYEEVLGDISIDEIRVRKPPEDKSQ